jgi:hypothetical protein
LWNFYLSSCEAAFEERTIGVLQIQFDKPLCRRERADLSARVRSDSPYESPYNPQFTKRRPARHRETPSALLGIERH